MNVWRRLFLVLVLFLMSLSWAQEEGVPREFVERIVGGPNANFYVGELPPAERLGFELPVPEGARVVGSTLSGEGEAYNAAVYLETEGSSDETVSFYRRALLADGWAQGQTYEQAGFLGSGDLQEQAVFCRDTTVLYFNDFADVPAEDSPTQLTLQIYNYPLARGSTPCDQDEQNYYNIPIPGLVAPPESMTLYLDGGGGDPGAGGSSSVLLQSDLGAEAIVDFYDAQLLAAGWTARDGAEVGVGDDEDSDSGEDGPIVWRRYSFTSDGAPWLGLLQILSDNAFPQQYLGQVIVIRTAP